MVELFRIGHFSIYLFGVAVALGIIVGMFIMSIESKRKGLDSDKIFDLALYTILASIIGARIYYVVAFDLSYYIQNPSEIFLISSGGMSIQGGLIGGTLFALWYTKKKNISFFEAADVAAPAIAIGQAIGRIGCDVFGIPMKNVYPWGINVAGQILHPAQMYEMYLNLILFIFLWSRRGKIRYNGELFIKYIIGFSINRALVEIFRTNPLVVGPLSIAHVTSIIIIILALIVNKKIKNNNMIVESNVECSRVKVPMYQYILVALIAILGTWFYYYIH
ncbi:prolipoprotein diacylglyceryl transferase [Clostridium sp. MSJ-11]|uniref:Phosphatidylglycerol--prolipoprotein diacylglyceryl transferase n=1 Tax=Clostridium mobile TaxID=2841512 RepID=A0ABS6EIS3_9CLOT|nr:prolipoprotein diacylglyceryl transferase [Clostridium mobile]MBU5485129.1 prolipoprotein diacylglyceryl transferase [Clostridium mobile]